MDIRAEYPYIKVYGDSKNGTHYVEKISETQSAHRLITSVGSALIDFILLDLSDYAAALRRYYEDGMLVLEDAPTDYQEMWNIIYGIAAPIKERHEYLHLFLVGKLNMVYRSGMDTLTQIETGLRVLEEVLTLQEIFADGIAMCCDAGGVSGLTQSELHVTFMGKYPMYLFHGFKTGLALAPSKDGKVDFEAVDAMDVTDKREQLRQIDRQHGDGVSLVSFIILEDLNDFLFYEFTEIMKQGLQVRKCKLCGQYFVLQSKHLTLFCDRIYQGKRTCK